MVAVFNFVLRHSKQQVLEQGNKERKCQNEHCEKPTPHSYSVPLPLQLATSQDQGGEKEGKSGKTLMVYSDSGKHSKSAHKANSPQKFERQKGKIHTHMKSQAHSTTPSKDQLVCFLLFSLHI